MPPKDDTRAWKPISCPECGHPNPPNAKHCLNCGYSFVKRAPKPAPARPKPPVTRVPRKVPPVKRYWWAVLGVVILAAVAVYFLYSPAPAEEVLAQDDMGAGADAGDSLDTATLISAGSGTGYLAKYTDANDYYKISVTSGQTLGVVITPQVERGFGIGLYDQYGQLVQNLYFNGVGLPVSVSVEATYSGYYFIRVLFVTGATEGTYSMTVEYPGPPKVTLSSPANGSTMSDPTPTLEWSSVSGADHYQLQVDVLSSSFYSPDIDNTTTSTSYTCSALSEYKHYWRVRAVSSEGINWPWSSTWDFTVTAPAKVTLSSPANNSGALGLTPTLEWSSVSDATKYQLQVSYNVTFDFGTGTNQIDTYTTSTSYTCSGLPNAYFYYWRVRAVNSNGTAGEWSDVWSWGVHY